MSMMEALAKFYTIFSSTKSAIEHFMGILDPVIEQTKDEHEHLYYHHIYEEEEHRLGRLKELIPLIEKFQQGKIPFSPSQRDFNRLLQELNLEKFGLHNFVEHLDLALFQFKDEERQRLLKEMRENSYSDYLLVKQMLIEINDRFDHSYEDPHEHHDHEGDHLAPPEAETHSAPLIASGSASASVALGKQKSTKSKSFTVGSLL
jgi:hypothetical protein